MSEPTKISDVGLRLLEKFKSPDPDYDRRLAEYEQRERERRERETALLEDRLERLRGIPLARHPGVTSEPWEGGLIHGPAGVGKTRRSIARLLAVSRSDGIFIDFMEYVDLCRDVEFDRANDFSLRRYDLLFDRPFLVLDDFGARHMTPFAADCVHRLLGRRDTNQQETLITSNLSLDEISAQWDYRIASRIGGFGSAVPMDGRDWRIR